MNKRMKRLAAPRTWAIPRKEKVWVARPLPGKHPIEESIPLVIALRDYLKVCDTGKEAEKILGRREVLVDGKVARRGKTAVGLMDIVSIPKINANYRVLKDKNGKIRLIAIKTDEAAWKLVKITNKTMVKGGKLQLNMHDGRNILVGKDLKDEYNSGDTLKISVPDQKILGKIEFTEGHLAFLTGGSHVGFVVNIEKIEKTRTPKANIVHFKEEFSTLQNYVFMIGTDVAEIEVPEVIR
jgi:small subunit ribosomal protein S4e